MEELIQRLRQLARSWSDLLVVTALVVGHYAPLLAGTHLFLFEHYLDHTLPTREYLRECLLAGRLPLWTPWQQGGAPLLASGQAGVLYLPNLLLLALFPAVRALQLYIVLHVLLAGWGAVLLARSFGLSRLAAALVGIGTAFGSRFVCQMLVMGDLLSTLVWFFWELWALERWRRRGWRGWPVAFVFLWALQLTAGHMQIAAQSALVCGLHLAGRLWLESVTPMRLWSCAAVLSRFAASVVLGGVLAAAHVLPCLELLGQSDRAGALDLRTSLQHDLPPPHVLRMLYPDVFGFQSGDPPRNPATWFGGSWNNYWDSSPYLGVAILLLWLCALVRRPRRDAGTTSYWLAIVTLLLSFGLWGGLWIVLHALPPFGFFRGPNRFLGFFACYALLLAGMKFDEWRSRVEPLSRQERGVLLGTTLAGLVLAVVFAAGFADLTRAGDLLRRATAQMNAERVGFSHAGAQVSLSDEALDYLGRNTHQALVVLASCVVVWFFSRAMAAWRERWAVAVVTLLALDLWLFAARYNVARPVQDLAVYRRLTERLRAVAPDLEQVYVLAVIPAGPLDAATYLPSVPHYAAVTGHWRLFNSFGAIQIGRFRYFDWTLFLQFQRRDPDPRLLEQLGIRYVLSREPIRAPDYHVLAEHPVYIHHIAGVPGYCYSPSRVQVVEGECSDRGCGLNVPRGETLIETLNQPWSVKTAEGAEAQVNHIDRGIDRVEIALVAPQDGTYVLREVLYPGWTVQVDDQLAQPMRANRLFFAIPLAAGAHRIELTYRCRPFEWGRVISALGLAALALLASMKSGQG